MEYVALVTLLLVAQYMVFTMLVGAARGKSGIKAPAVTGDENFERAYRVQMNTLEQLVMTLPALWLSGIYFDSLVAALLGLAFFLGRVLYRAGYVKAPRKARRGLRYRLSGYPRPYRHRAVGRRHRPLIIAGAVLYAPLWVQAAPLCRPITCPASQKHPSSWE